MPRLYADANGAALVTSAPGGVVPSTAYKRGGLSFTPDGQLYVAGLNSVSVASFGADNTGATDTSAAFIAAATALGTSGGTIYIPPGIYQVQGLPLKPGLTWVGSSPRGTTMITTTASGTILRLPASPSNHMFLSSATGDFLGGGVINCELDGNQDYRTGPSYDGINFSSVLGELHMFAIRDCYIHNFRRGYMGSSGTGGDQDNYIFHNLFYYNFIGVYATDHPVITEYNDFRYNFYGISGLSSGAQAVYDLPVSNCRFAYNKYGIAPQSGGAAFNFMTINGNVFTRNEVLDIEMGAQGLVNNNRFAPPSPYTITTFTISGTTATINCSTIRSDPGLKAGDPCYFAGTGETRLDKVSGLTVLAVNSTTQFTVTIAAGGSSGSGGTFYPGRNHIHAAQGGWEMVGNIFRNEANTEIKPDWMIYIDNSGQNLVGGLIANNRSGCTQAGATLTTQAWIKFLGVNATELRDLTVIGNNIAACGQFFDGESSTRIEQSIITDNKWTCNVIVPNTVSRFRIGSSTFGNNITNNFHRLDTNSSGVDGGQYVFDVDLKRSVFTGNLMRAAGASYTALVNVSARTTAASGTTATLGATATGTCAFAAGPGAITDTCGVGASNFLSSTS